jgi:cystathionine beta-lyase/cystathionine gamma-synthase
VNSNPFECWLASRGLRTLPLRMERVSKSAMRVAEFLASRGDVSAVFYPGLPRHPSRLVAERLLPNGCGGMLAFELPGGRETVSAVFRRLSRCIPFSPTLADARTTVSYPAGTSHKFMSPSERKRVGISDGLVRLSIGLEEPETLCRELGRALDDAARSGAT